MKKLVFIVMVIGVFVLTGCGSKSDSEADKGKEEPMAETKEENKVDDKEKEESKEESEDKGKVEEKTEDNGGKDVSDSDKQEVTLQVLKQDEEEGLTIENSELYQAIQAEVEADPLMGEPNDLSLFPFDIVEFEDGSSSLMFLVINRLDKPIQNLVFNLTFGNGEDKSYIFEDHQVDLPEDYLGVLEKDGVVPILLEIEKEDEALFAELTMDNVLLELENVGIDFVE